MKKKIQTGFRWFAMSVLAAFSALIFWTVWSLLYPYDILTVNPGSWAVQNVDKRIPRGEKVWIYIDYCAKEHKSPRMDIAIEQDSRLMYLTPQYPAATMGCHKTVLPLATIPRVLAIESTTAKGDGKARLFISLKYPVNAIRDVEYNYYTDQFVIDP